MIFPDYSGGSIVNLMSSIEQGLGSDFYLYPPATALPISELQGCENIVFLVVDGLGYEYLTNAASGSYLHEYLKSSLTSVCPSTTSAAIPTFLTGVAPQQHGFTGWFTWFREVGSILAALPFEPRHGGGTLGKQGVDPGLLSGVKPFFERIQVRSHVVVPDTIAESEFNLAFHDGASICSYVGLEDFFKVIKTEVDSKDGQNYVYAYWPEFDRLAHSKGVGSKEVASHFAEFDAAFASFIRRMHGSGCKVIVTADHGFIDVPSSGLIQMSDHQELADTLVMPLCGEQRFAYSYVHPDKAEFFRQYIESELSYAIDLFSSAELIAQGRFGLGQPHSELESRVGHYTLVMKPGYKIRDRVLGEKPKRHIGVHGGITAEEMYVPLVVVDC